MDDSYAMQKQLTLSLPVAITGGLLVAAIVVIAVLVTVIIARGDNSPKAEVAIATATTQPSPAPVTTVPNAIPPTVAVFAPPTEAPVTTTTYGSPFAYCSAAGTIDAPDNRYTGAQYPQSILDGLSTAMRRPLISKVVPWRCVLGQVWGCFVGANLPCGKIDTSNEPTQRMNDYCRTNPDTTHIPAAITGHSTLYVWACRGELAVPTRDAIPLDARGFGAEFWYHLYPP